MEGFVESISLAPTAREVVTYTITGDQAGVIVALIVSAILLALVVMVPSKRPA